jgi:PST family polysaccharide transporter
VVQVLNIIISIVPKLIAVFIGPAGMGIISLLNSAIISSWCFGFRNRTSAVKHISGKHKENDLSSVSTMVSTVKIGLGYRYFGALLAIFFSSWLTITLWKYRLYFFYLYLSYGFAKLPVN